MVNPASLSVRSADRSQKCEELKATHNSIAYVIIKPKRLNPGDKKVIEEEPIVSNVSFNVFKFNNRPKPVDRREIVIICCFSEFGCETVGVLYCLPRLLQMYQGKYIICVGWYGRDYLYKHLVDEFWELKEEFQWLREYARAFHNESKNLKRIEEALRENGNLVPSDRMGYFAVGNVCNKCKHMWSDTTPCEKCIKCGEVDIVPSLFGNVNYWKQKVRRIPIPSEAVLNIADGYVGPNPVGVFARARKCYGRNLQPEFYVKLIGLLRELGYTPIWLGEKQSTLECPVSDVIDFSRRAESRNLDLTLAILHKCKFTIQYWTASTRLASMMGTPYILFESPDQIWGQGQEGFRRKLCDLGPSKLVISHYNRIYEDNDDGISLTRRAIKEVEAANYEDIFGALETDNAAQAMKNRYEEKYVRNITGSKKGC